MSKRQEVRDEEYTFFWIQSDKRTKTKGCLVSITIRVWLIYQIALPLLKNQVLRK